VVGVSNLDTQPCRNVHATVSAQMSGSGKASGQQVNLSMTVKRYLYPLEWGSGPTRLTWMASNLALGGAKVESGVVVQIWQ